MRPQKQLVVHDASKGVRGDCARAVIASLLDIDIETIPNFAQEAEGSSYKFYSRIEDFLELHGYEMLWYRSPVYHLKDGVDVYHYISGPSPRGQGLFHAVVGLNGVPFFDPHPSDAGLSGDKTEWHHSFLIPT